MQRYTTGVKQLLPYIFEATILTGVGKGEDVFIPFIPITHPIVLNITYPIVLPITRPIVLPITRPIVLPITRPIVLPITHPIVLPIIRPIVLPITRPIVRPITRPIVLQQVPGHANLYKSVDSVPNTSEAVQYPIEFLDSLELPGVPSHLLRLKVGAPIMMLRKLDPPKLCNGT